MQPNPNEVIRAHIRVKGRVQGVGFRAHVEYHAGKIGGLTGWVRNVGWDMVECVIEGERANVEQLITFIKQGPKVSKVNESSIEYETPTGEFKGFGVKVSR
ncbi:MAG: acylphosphatase [Anaerolineales bacterium]|nr:acylphosphatase [Anaerolineales bacterium]